MSIRKFADCHKKGLIRCVRLVGEPKLTNSLWVKFDYAGRQCCQYFEDTGENRTVLERLEHSEAPVSFPMPRPAVA